MNTMYEVIEKATGIMTITSDMTLGSDYVEVTINKGYEGEKVVRFSNENQQGNLLNDDYSIRQVGDQLTPNNDGVVTDEGIEVPISQETRKDIQDGVIDPDSIKA